MIRTPLGPSALALAFLLPGPAASSEPRLRVEVEAGTVDRQDVPVRATIPTAEVPLALLREFRDRPLRLDLREVAEDGRAVGSVAAQAERRPDDAVVLTFLLPGSTPAGQTRSFRALLYPGALRESTPEAWLARVPGGLELRTAERTLFRYNTSPVGNARFPNIPARDAYIAPAFTKSGALITGDYSPFHPHHRGFFLAYTSTKVGDQKADFWNIQSKTGLIRHDHLEDVTTGPVSARFSAFHRWEVPGKGTAMRERWDVEVYAGLPSGYLFDLTSTQQAEGEPFELVPYRYGGMAYRGAEPFVKGPLDVLTNEGSGRRERDQKPARWVDLTGPVEEGSDRYAGAMILDHPENPHHPTVARIHPTTLPFFCWVPAHDEPLTIATDRPTTFRYRVLVHDGRPEGERNERLWRDFAAPVTTRVRVETD